MCRSVPSHLDALAAAYADNVQFNQPFAVDQEGLELVKSHQTSEMEVEIQQHMKLFKAKRDYTESFE